MTTSDIKVLVVDDEPAIRRLLRVGLSTEGYAIREAATAREAVERLAEDLPDLVILDRPARTSCGNGARKRSICRSSSCRAAPTRPASSRLSRPAQTTTSPSLSG